MSFSTYNQALEWLYDTQSTGIKLGLENIGRLIKDLAFDETAHRIIHVAGTNGKGSTCAMIDAICRSGGICTGLFTSPHLISFRERIRIDGEMISEHEVVNGLSNVRELIGKWGKNQPTFFEITTALGLDHFARKKADVIVLETGLGGRLDSTNAVTPTISVITPIALDHQAWLGDTLEKIAAEKAGIIKPGIPVISSPQESAVENVLRETARRVNAPIEFVRDVFSGPNINLSGNHQRQNAALALRTIQRAGLGIDGAAAHRGLASVSWPGRFQCIGDRLVLDGAHNAAAVSKLVQTWREEFRDEKATVILGYLADKNPRTLCRLILPIASRVIAVPVRSRRACSPEQIRDIIVSSSEIPCTTVGSVSEALKLTSTGPQRTLITGSFFLVGEALSVLAGAQTPPRETDQ